MGHYDYNAIIFEIFYLFAIQLYVILIKILKKHYENSCS
jgi:hypothetical protein